jgi:hypothetical protein
MWATFAPFNGARFAPTGAIFALLRAIFALL